MKKNVLVFVFVFLFGTAGSAFAQTSKNYSEQPDSVRVSVKRSSTTSAEITPVRRRANRVQPAEIDNRKEYMQDGQLATYTGHEATAVNAEQFQSLKKKTDEKREEQ